MDTSPDLGPQPTRTDAPRTAALRVLRALVAAGPTTLVELTGALGGHPNTTRVQLEHLVSQGFAREIAQHASGRGRPARAYEATVSARQIAVEDLGRDNQSALVEAIAEHLDLSPDPAAAALALGRIWGSRLMKEKDVGLVGTLASQGFTPEETADGIALRTCPMLASARDRPEVVCGIHQGLIDSISPERWRLQPFARPGTCMVRRCDQD